MITLTREEAQQVLDAFQVATTHFAKDRQEIIAAETILRTKIKRAEIWEIRDLSKCECDHNEYCQHCWPLELRGNRT